MGNIVIPFASVIAATLAALLVSQWMAGSSDHIVDRGRLKTIDGLRAFLALWVLFAHFPVAWGMAKTGVWSAESSVWPLRNFAVVAVTAFFMITGMLFYGKIRRESDLISWRELYIGRLRRLVPMYAATITLMIILIFSYTGWEVRSTIPRLFMALGAWGLFTIPGNPPINNYENTRYVVAGVIWTLRYEWLFYLLLPALAVFFKRKSVSRNKAIVTLTLFITALSVLPDTSIFWLRPKLLIPFLFGMVAYEIAGKPEWTRHLRGKAATFAIIISIVLALLSSPVGYTVTRFILVFCAFACIASGNSIGGVLLSKGARLLGDASYSVYLLHGIFLSILFHAAPAVGINLSTSAIWAALPIISLAVASISIFTYRNIELRFMRTPGKQACPPKLGKQVVNRV